MPNRRIKAIRAIVDKAETTSSLPIKDRWITSLNAENKPINGMYLTGTFFGKKPNEIKPERKIPNANSNSLNNCEFLRLWEKSETVSDTVTESAAKINSMASSISTVYGERSRPAKYGAASPSR